MAGRLLPDGRQGPATCRDVFGNEDSWGASNSHKGPFKLGPVYALLLLSCCMLNAGLADCVCPHESVVHVQLLRLPAWQLRGADRSLNHGQICTKLCKVSHFCHQALRILTGEELGSLWHAIEKPTHSVRPKCIPASGQPGLADQAPTRLPLQWRACIAHGSQRAAFLSVSVNACCTSDGTSKGHDHNGKLLRQNTQASAAILTRRLNPSAIS